MNNFFLGLICSIGFLLVLLSLEYTTRRNGFNKELTRRMAHVLSGLFGALMGLVLEPSVFIIFAVILLAMISLSYVVKFFSSIHGVKRKTYGELLLPLGILVAYLIAHESNVIFLASVLILTISDPLAGIVGNISEKKTAWGSIVFFISALIILFAFFGFDQPAYLLLIALVVTATEKFSPYGTDNLTIPLISSLLLRVF